jgi:hypothetical protein
VIAEVHRTSGVMAYDETARDIFEEAARAPGTEQLFVLVDPATGEGYSIHLWRDRQSYEAFAERRQELVARVEEAGARPDPGQLFDVAYPETAD